jgi:hypothetical protein
MKYLITESQADNGIANLLKKMDIKLDILYWQDNGRDSITGTVYLYKNNDILGYRHGYEFFYSYDPRFKELKNTGHWPNIEKLDLFKFMPSEMVIKFFSGKVENYLKKYIAGGYTTLGAR